MDAETSIFSAHFLRENAWILVLAAMLVVVSVRFASGKFRTDRRKDKAAGQGNRYDPASLPDLSPKIRKLRIQGILAGLIVVLTFILVAILSHFAS